MTLTLIIWIVLIEAEAFRNWWLIKKYGNVNHNRQTIYRIAFSFVFWLVTPIVIAIEPDRWWAMPLMMAFTFFFLFDLSLNLMRFGIKKWYYFGTESKLDRIQGQWPLPFWFLKFFLMATGTTLYFYGFSAI